MVPPGSIRVSRARTYSGTSDGRSRDFAYGTVALCGARFHALRLSRVFVTSAGSDMIRNRRPTTLGRQRMSAYTGRVWADPFSLATTQGVSVDLLSSGYLDVSVPPLVLSVPMCSARDSAVLPALGFPIRVPAGQRLFSASPRLIAAVHVLHRLLVPRHPPCALLILTVIEPCRTWLGDSLLLALLCSFQGPRRGLPADPKEPPGTTPTEDATPNLWG